MYFNSYMVRLEEGQEQKVFKGNVTFQFLYGTIGSG